MTNYQDEINVEVVMIFSSYSLKLYTQFPIQYHKIKIFLFGLVGELILLLASVNIRRSFQADFVQNLNNLRQWYNLYQWLFIIRNSCAFESTFNVTPQKKRMARMVKIRKIKHTYTCILVKIGSHTVVSAFIVCTLFAQPQTPEGSVILGKICTERHTFMKT